MRTFPTLSGEKRIKALIHELEKMEKEAQYMINKLEDAEITIARIGFNEQTAVEAMLRYEAKYGSVKDKAHKYVRGVHMNTSGYYQKDTEHGKQ